MATQVCWQPSLLGSDAPPAASGGAPSEPSPLHFGHAVRHELGRGAWLDEVPFAARGTTELFDLVLTSAPWGGVETRPMYDRIVEVPRLYSGVWPDPPAELGAMSQALSDHYGLGLTSISANHYRDGADSVAWHGDRVGRHRAVTVVAILTLGSPRRFLLRPTGGGPSLSFEPGPGDLVVMGGTCQRTFEHSVPKCARAGPRICVMFREPGGN
jgi:alkylated DNA repair dioxygenase AlkB